MEKTKELNSLNFDKLNINDCEFIYSQGYLAVCNNGKITKIIKEG